MARTVVLRSSNDERGSRHLDATITDAGDLVLEGQDLGPGVEEFFGEGLIEYEWAMTVRAAHLEAAARALGGGEAADVLELLKDWYSSGRDHLVKPALEDAGIPVEFWSRVGD